MQSLCAAALAAPPPPARLLLLWRLQQTESLKPSAPSGTTVCPSRLFAPCVCIAAPTNRFGSGARFVVG
jgi:hypothetical protein